MEGLVNYSSEDEQDDYSYTKVAVRERGSGGGRIADGSSGSLKRSYDHHSKSGSCERDSSPHRNKGDQQQHRFKTGNNNFHEDKYKIDRRADKSRDHRDKRESKESRNARDVRDEGRDYEHNHKYDYKKQHDDHKRYREPKGRGDYKRDGNDYYRDDKRYNRYDERKSSYANNSNYKDRFNNTKSRYDERKQYDDHRFNDERRTTTTTNEERRGGGGSSGSGGSNFDDRRRGGDFNDRRNYNNEDDRKTDRRNNDDRRTQRSYNEDRSNRPRRSNSPTLSQRNNSNNNKYSERKEDTKRERKRHSSRSRSRSHSDDNLNETNLAPNNNSQQRTSANELATEAKRPEGVESQACEKKTLPTARNFEALLSLPLSENAPKHPNVVTVPAVSAAAAAGSNTAATTATVQLPSYYNPNVINPNKYVEQMQKRKLIWGAKKSEDSASKWGHAQFSQDQDGKVASKFMRLMGIKSSTGGGGDGGSTTSPNDSDKKSPNSSTSPTNNTDVKSREAMFSSMEQQYEVARQVTHTMRGVGLGFGSQSRPY